MPKSNDYATASPHNKKDKEEILVLKDEDGVFKCKKKTANWNEERKSAFVRRFYPEKILGAKDSGGKVMFLMKYRGLNAAQFVPAEEANLRCPQIVIQFYEKHLSFITSPSNKNKDS